MRRTDELAGGGGGRRRCDEEQQGSGGNNEGLSNGGSHEYFSNQLYPTAEDPSLLKRDSCQEMEANERKEKRKKRGGTENKKEGFEMRNH